MANLEENSGIKLEKSGTEKAYFIYKGKPLFSFGGGSDFTFYVKSDTYDYKRWADWAEKHGINHLRAYPPLSWRHIEKFINDNDGSLDNAIFPYEETVAGSRKFDLTKFSDDYWEHFREQCEYFSQKGIIVHLCMWNGWQLRDNGLDWQGHFFNPANNINNFTSHLGAKTEGYLELYHSVADEKSQLLEAEKAWYFKLLEVTYDLDNVYYDMVHEIAEHCGEWQKTTLWIDEMAQSLRAEWQRIGAKRPLILGMDAGGLDGFSWDATTLVPLDGSQVDWIFSRSYFDLAIWGKAHSINRAIACRNKYQKPYLGQECWDDDKTKYSYRVPEQRGHIRKYYWKYLMAKCQQLDLYYKDRNNVYNPPGSPHNYDPNGWNQFEDDALVLKRFWNEITDYSELWFDGHMNQAPGTLHYVLSSPTEAICYVSSGTGELNVTYQATQLICEETALMDGAYNVDLIDPRKGTVASKFIDVIEGCFEIGLPEFVDDFAVHLQARI